MSEHHDTPQAAFSGTGFVIGFALFLAAILVEIFVPGIKGPGAVVAGLLLPVALWASIPKWRHYIFSVDHKVIGMQYAVTALVFLFIGFLLMLAMRFQLAKTGGPGGAVEPFVIPLLGIEMTPDRYNEFGAMHGTIMVFMGVVPLAVGGFGNYVLPLQIGAPDMAFPRLNMLSYWCYWAGAVIMVLSFFFPEGGAARYGWTSYPPLSTAFAQDGQLWWLFGMFMLILSSLLGSINFIVTTVHLRAPGLSFFRLPFFVWAQLITSFLLLLAFPPLQGAAIFQIMDHVAGTSFFAPTGLMDKNLGLVDVAGGGSPLLWQHLFWFLAHPEVYVLILPAMGIVSEIVANNTRKPLWGYRLLVYSAIFLGFMSFIVWAHHMFMTGMGTAMSSFFQTTTMIISVPSVIILTCLLLSLYGSSIRYRLPMLFALAFLPMFAIGGLTGLPLGLTTPDIYLHDTYYVIGHFHYVVAPGTLLALFGGIYFWYPKAVGRYLNNALGQLHFWGTFIGMNLVFFPMFLQGLRHINRRLYDQGYSEHGFAIQNLTHWQLAGAIMIGVASLLFAINFFMSLRSGKKVESDNPWESTTLEWATPTPPPHGNFDKPVQVYRDPYEYSVPGRDTDYLPQNVEG